MKADINERINQMDWVARNVYEWRVIIRTLKRYRKRLEKDMLHDRVAHLDVYIKEMEEARKR